MRTIKFRGKRLDGQGWVVGFYQPHANGKVVFIGDYSGLTDIPKLHKVILESVGQWTGLVDKNGKEIYEGDMVKAENTQNVGEIKYVHEHGSFLVYSHDENGAYYEYLDIGLCEKYFEVIGNVFDNGDLYDC